jgi:glycosyltransferase involved in cell wall biosynthesis
MIAAAKDLNQQAELGPTIAIAAERLAAVELVVIVPTYKRPDGIRATLRSLEAQKGAPPFAVIVIENDANGRQGTVVAASELNASGRPGMVLVEARQGNCFAYNAGFLAGRLRFPEARHFAVIDDDEAADPDWLATLLAASIAHSAEIVGGPQVPVFEDRAGRERFARHPIFQPQRHETGPVPLIHSTGNCLIASHVVDAMGHPVLDERFNFTGGGDTDFFTRCAARGFRFAWSNEAIVREAVPARRTARDWVRSRSLRNGMLSADIQRRHSPGAAGRLKVLAKSIALLAVAPARSAILALKTRSVEAGSYHVLVAAGRLLSEFGWRHEQYRQPEKN